MEGDEPRNFHNMDHSGYMPNGNPMFNGTETASGYAQNGNPHSGPGYVQNRNLQTGSGYVPNGVLQTDPPPSFMKDFKSEYYYDISDRPQKMMRNLPQWKQKSDRMFFIEPETDHAVAVWDVKNQGERVKSLFSNFSCMFLNPNNFFRF